MIKEKKQEEWSTLVVVPVFCSECAVACTLTQLVVNLTRSQMCSSAYLAPTWLSSVPFVVCYFIRQFLIKIHLLYSLG